MIYCHSRTLPVWTHNGRLLVEIYGLHKLEVEATSEAAGIYRCYGTDRVSHSFEGLSHLVVVGEFHYRVFTALY